MTLGFSLLLHGGIAGFPHLDFFHLEDQKIKEKEMIVEIQFEAPPLLPEIEDISEQKQFVEQEDIKEVIEPIPVDKDEKLVEQVEPEKVVEQTEQEEVVDVQEQEVVEELVEELPEEPVEQLPEEKTLPLEKPVEEIVQLVPPVEKNQPDEIEEQPVIEEATQVAQIRDDHAEIMMRYEDIIKQQIQSVRRYPKFARRMKLEGIVTIEFSFFRDGKIHYAKIVKPCPYKLLNEAAKKSIKKASPFPPFPSNIVLRELTMSVDIVFKMNR